MKAFLIIITLILLGSCASTSSNSKLDQVPMYGGVDRQEIPELKVADEKFIAEVSEAFNGDLKRAATYWISIGFEYYQKDDLKNAIRRFNQAWLLDESNPEVYSGFGAVLHDKGQNCDAMKMMEKAILLNPPKNQGFYPDAGRIITLCAVEDQSITDAERIVLFEKSENLFIDAESFEPKKGYLYSTWATAYYWRGEYIKAWEMVDKAERNGGQLQNQFLNLLKSKQARL